MSFCSVDLALKRIKSTSPEDPVSVFECPVEGEVNVVFANTVETQRWIAKGKAVLLGVFDTTLFPDAKTALAPYAATRRKRGQKPDAAVDLFTASSIT